jgi:hypothetical protein
MRRVGSSIEHHLEFPEFLEKTVVHERNVLDEGLQDSP